MNKVRIRQGGYLLKLSSTNQMIIANSSKHHRLSITNTGRDIKPFQPMIYQMSHIHRRNHQAFAHCSESLIIIETDNQGVNGNIYTNVFKICKKQ